MSKNIMLFNSPISSQKVDQIIDVLNLSEGDRVLDVGCGTGEFLIRVIEQKQVQGLGIDQQSELIYVANKMASSRIAKNSYEFIKADVNSFILEEDSYDLGICIGSTHAFGSGEAAYPNTIRELMRAVKPGGLILVGEGYWKQEPEPEYLELIGEPTGIYRSHAENIWFGEQQGLIPLYATVSNEDEWDHFEWSHKLNIEQEFITSSENFERLSQSRKWRDGYLKWGRSTMGFGFYLFRTPIYNKPK